MQLSFVIPARNEEKLLPRCIAAIQHSRAVCDVSAEVIVVSDSSTDRTVLIARSLGCRVVPISARSRSVARNVGAKKARGRIIAFVDADTLVDVDFVSNVAVLGQDTRQVYWFRQASLEPSMLGALYFAVVNGLSSVTPTFSPAIAVTRDYWRSNPPFDEGLGSFEDLHYLRRAHKGGHSRYVQSQVRTSVRRIAKFGLFKALIHFICAVRDPYKFEWRAIND